jgi:hypothetical protein
VCLCQCSRTNFTLFCHMWVDAPKTGVFLESHGGDRISHNQKDFVLMNLVESNRTQILHGLMPESVLFSLATDGVSQPRLHYCTEMLQIQSRLVVSGCLGF